MTRLLAAAPVSLATFAAALALAALATRAGLMSDDAVNLWAGAITASDGEMTVGRLVAVYPSVPFAAAALAEFVMPAATPTPSLVASGLLAAMAGACLLMLREVGLSAAVASLAAVLLVLHPALLRAAVAGPADVFFAAFLFLLAKGLHDLRVRSTASEVMTVGLALIGLTFSHPMGAVFTVAVAPFLPLAVRPTLIAKSAASITLALVFPTVFCAMAFSYLSWVFPGSGWSFLTTPSRSFADWVVGMARLIGVAPNIAVASGAVALLSLAVVMGAPVAVAAWTKVLRRPALLTPQVALLAALVVASVLAVVTRMAGDPAVLLAAAPVLAAMAVIRIPDVRRSAAGVVAWLVLGWIGGAAAVLAADPRVGLHLRDIAAGAAGDRERLDTLDLGAATAGRDGILVDTLNAPAVILGRGAARGLLGPSSEAFTLTLLFGRIDEPFVAVPDPATATGGTDRLNRAFPALHRRGLPGYRAVYRNASWRLFQRIRTENP